MRYKDEWRGHLNLNYRGEASWDGQPIGRIHTRPQTGAKSPGGMVTNCVWIAESPFNETRVEFASQTQAIDWLVRCAHEKKEY